MADFNAAIEVVLGHEGGRSDHIADRGGKTNYGITHALGNQYGVDDVYTLTRAQAITIYRKHFWDGEMRGHLDAVRDQAIATAILSMGVNTGTAPAVRTLQVALRELGAASVVVDGQLGPKTIAAINATAPGALLRVFKKEWALFYCRLVRDSARRGRAYIEGNMPRTREADRALLDVRQAENLVGWVTRALS